MKDEKILEDFFIHEFESFEYWADIRIEGIRKREHLDLSPAEFKALQTLIATDTGEQALRKLLVDCGKSNLHSTLAYIDGSTGEKTLELVSEKTGEPIAAYTLHEHLSPLTWGDKWEKMKDLISEKIELWRKEMA